MRSPRSTSNEPDFESTPRRTSPTTHFTQKMSSTTANKIWKHHPIDSLASNESILSPSIIPTLIGFKLPGDLTCFDMNFAFRHTDPADYVDLFGRVNLKVDKRTVTPNTVRVRCAILVPRGADDKERRLRITDWACSKCNIYGGVQGKCRHLDALLSTYRLQPEAFLRVPSLEREDPMSKWDSDYERIVHEMADNDRRNILTELAWREESARHAIDEHVKGLFHDA